MANEIDYDEQQLRDKLQAGYLKRDQIVKMKTQKQEEVKNLENAETIVIKQIALLDEQYRNL